MKTLNCVVAYAVGIIAVGRADPADKTFVNVKYGYSFVVPSAWHVDEGSVPYIFSFPPSQAGPQGQIPEGGAVVQIIPADEFVGKYVKNISEWIRWNTRIKQRDVQRKEFRCESLEARHSHICTEVRSVFQLTPDDPALIDTSYYFILGGKYFRGFLEYHEGDKNALSYLSVFKSIIDSIEAR